VNGNDYGSWIGGVNINEGLWFLTIVMFDI